jgi:hypothetical protein
MQINILRIVAEIAIESYVISLVLFILFIAFLKTSSHCKAIFFNSINLLGLLGMFIAFSDELYFLFKTPKRNSELIIYEAYKKDWLLFVPMIGFLLFIIIFFQGKRRRNMRWSFIGLSLFGWIKLSNFLHNWLLYQQYVHKPIKLLIHFFSITKDSIWFYVLFIVGIFAIAWIDYKGGFYHKEMKI